MSHFSEDVSAGGGDAFDGGEGAVRVEWVAHGGVAVGIAVSGGDLAVGGEAGDDGFRGVEFSFAVGDGVGVDFSDFHSVKPRGGVRGDGRADVSGDVAGDVVVDERGPCRGIVDFGMRILDGISGHRFVMHDPPVGQEAGFDEGLEAVADTEKEAAAVFEEVGDGVRDPGVAEDGGDEFGGAVGFVSRGEAAGDEQDLGLTDAIREGGEGFLDMPRGEVAEDEDFGKGTGALEGAGGIVFRVGSGEGGDQNFWF